VLPRRGLSLHTDLLTLALTQIGRVERIIFGSGACVRAAPQNEKQFFVEDENRLRIIINVSTKSDMFEGIFEDEGSALDPLMFVFGMYNKELSIECKKAHLSISFLKGAMPL